MPLLENPRHELFAHGLAEGKTADQAYVDAGFRKNRHNAAALARQKHILTRVAELQAVGAEKTAITIEYLIQKLEKAEALAERLDQPSAMVAADMGIAKLCGFLIEKRIDVTPRRSLAEIDARIRQLLGSE